MGYTMSCYSGSKDIRKVLVFREAISVSGATLDYLHIYGDTFTFSCTFNSNEQHEKFCHYFNTMSTPIRETRRKLRLSRRVVKWFSRLYNRLI